MGKASDEVIIHNDCATGRDFHAALSSNKMVVYWPFFVEHLTLRNYLNLVLRYQRVYKNGTK